MTIFIPSGVTKNYHWLIPRRPAYQLPTRRKGDLQEFHLTPHLTIRSGDGGPMDELQLQWFQVVTKSTRTD